MAKQTPASDTGPTPPAAYPSYQVVGLQPADTMPIQFNGRQYDLASLSAEELAYLLQFPQQVPYLRAGENDTSQSNG